MVARSEAGTTRIGRGRRVMPSQGRDKRWALGDWYTTQSGREHGWGDVARGTT